VGGQGGRGMAREGTGGPLLRGPLLTAAAEPAPKRRWGSARGRENCAEKGWGRSPIPSPPQAPRPWPTAPPALGKAALPPVSWLAPSVFSPSLPCEQEQEEAEEPWNGRAWEGRSGVASSQTGAGPRPWPTPPARTHVWPRRKEDRRRFDEALGKAGADAEERERRMVEEARTEREALRRAHDKQARAVRGVGAGA
jgi:hypothetical protein